MNIKITGAFVVLPVGNSFKVEKKTIYVKDGIVSYKPNFDIADKTINAENKILMSGFVNAHHHIYSCLSKGIPAEVPFKDFMGTLQNLWWKLDRALDEDSTKLSTVLTVQDCIKSGVTTVFDHHISASFVKGSLDVMKDVFEAYGVNNVLCFEASDRNGKEIFADSLKENIRFCKENLNSPTSKGMIGMHALLTLNDESLKMISENTEKFPIHCHIAEDEIDEIQSKEKYGKSVIQRLKDFGLLRKNSLLVHASNIDDEEIEMLKDKELFVAQAVDSNMNNALNAADTTKLINSGLSVVAGTDGMSSNMLKALKNTYLLTKFQNQNPDIGFGEMNALLTNMYKLKTGFGFPLGLIDGEPADLAIFDYIPATPLNDNTFLGHFIFGITESQAQWVIKGDKVLLDDFKIKPKYEDLINRRMEISKDLFDRFEGLEKL